VAKRQGPGGGRGPGFCPRAAHHYRHARTTIVSAAILILFGTGPVRGFAITLIFGLLANLFTAVFVSRVIFDAILGRKGRGEALSI